jgi:hypothetical protein
VGSTIVIILIAIALLILALIVFLIIRRQRYSGRCGNVAGPSKPNLPWSRSSITMPRRSESASYAPMVHIRIRGWLSCSADGFHR